ALGAGDRGRGVARLALIRPRPEALLVGPASDHEVAVLARDRAQQLEALETRRAVDRALPRGEARLQLGLLTSGDGEAVDLHDGHESSRTVGAVSGAARIGMASIRAVRGRGGDGSLGACPSLVLHRRRAG